MRKRLGQLLVLAASVTALGCSEKDATKCQQALDGDEDQDEKRVVKEVGEEAPSGFRVSGSPAFRFWPYSGPTGVKREAGHFAQSY